MNTSTRSVIRSNSIRRWILTGAIAPAAFITSVRAADVFLPPDFTIDSDTATPLFFEGLIEGKIVASDDEVTPNPNNSSPELGLRMATIAQNPGGGQINDGWGNPATWVYTGQIFTGPNGVISLAANNDDTDWFRINGTVVMNDNGWDTAVATVVTGLTPNTWVDFEYRVSDTGGGGAGPSGQNLNGATNWTTSIGAVISHDNEANSLNALDYTFGLGGVNSYEPAGGGATLFRYQNGFGLDDDLVVQGSATITVNGNNVTIAEKSLRFTNAAPATLTINDGAGTPHKTLSIVGTTQWATFASGGSDVVLDGTTDFRPIGAQTDNGNPVRVIRNGAGKLILESFDLGSSLGSTTFVAGSGTIELTAANGVTPVPDAKFEILSGGTLRIGSPNAAPASFSNQITAAGSGTLQHTSAAIDTITSTITVLSNQNLTFDITGGRLITGGITANQSGARITKSGPNLLRATGSVSARNLTINAGRFEVGNINLFTNPVLNGGVFALTSTAGTSNVPNPFIITGAGAVEGRGGSFGAASNVVQLTGGGTFRLAGPSGLAGSFFGGDDAGANANFGTYDLYTSYLATRPGLEVSALTTAGGVEQLSFNPSGVDAAMYSAYGQTRTNNIVSRMAGKIFIETPGTYTFATTSDDGSMLFIDGQTVVNNNFYQGMTRRLGAVTLTAGFHDIDIGFYEGGGGNGFVVDWSGPGITGTQVLPNSVLFPNLNPEQFGNPLNVTGAGTVQVLGGAGQFTNTVTISDGANLSVTGNSLIANSVVLPTSGGTYTFSPQNETTLSQITDNGNPVTIIKSGSGVLTIDNVGVPQLQNAGSVINVNEGSLGILLGAAQIPTGNATINFNGGGVVLSSKGGNQLYTIPNFVGTNVNLQARKLGSGVAGTPEIPVIITLQGDLNIPAGSTVNLGTADNYIEEISGSASGTGTVGITGGKVQATTETALQGLRVNFNVATAVLDLLSNAPSVGSLHNEPGVASTTFVGDGVGGSAVLTLTGADTARYTGTLAPATNNSLAVVKTGTGMQSIGGPAQVVAYGINSGILELNSAAFADPNALINLAGGTLQFANQGLYLRIFDSDPGAALGSVPNAYSGILNTLGGVLQRYEAMGTPSITVSTAANGNNFINYNPGAGAEAPFAIHGQTDADTIEAIFTGLIDLPVGGNWTFDPRSDDGTMIYIDGQLVVNNNIPQGIGHVSRAATVNLSQGRHSIVMTYNEGGGGAGMYVNVTAPGGSPTLLSNNLLINSEVSVSNPVNIVSSSTINANQGTVALGNAEHTSSAVLTVGGGGQVSFPQTTVNGGTALSYIVQPSTTIRPGRLVGVDTVNVSGGGNVLLDYNGGDQLLTGNVNVNGSSVTAATVPGGADPLGGATVNLSNGGALQLTTLSPGADTAYLGPVTIGAGGGAIRAGRFGAGVPGTFVMTQGALINVNNAAPLSFSAADGYTLVIANTVTSNGPISSTGGNVQTGLEVTGTTLAVTGGRLDTLGPLSFTGGANVSSGATLRFNGNGYTGGTINVSGTVEFNGNTTGALPLAVDGGRIRVTSGVVDFAGSPVTGTAPTITPTNNVLDSRAYTQTNPPGGFGTDQGVAFILGSTPFRSVDLAARDLNFGPVSVGDAEFDTFFGAALPAAFTASFSGVFTAPSDGPFTFGSSIQDDNTNIWVDVNQNGVFERQGSAGDELLVTQGCCGGADPNATTNGVVNLLSGQKYAMAFIVEDTGGGGSYAAKWDIGSFPGGGGLTKFVNPGDVTQAGIWSKETRAGGARVEIGADSELRTGAMTNVTEVFLNGVNAKLSLSGTSTIDVVRNAVGASVFEVTAGSVATVNHFTVTPGSTVSKVGPGTLNLPSLTVGGGGTFSVEDGLAVYTAQGTAGVANALSGSINISGTGTFDLQGTLSGSAIVNAGGTLKGDGTLAALTAAASGIVSPGITGGSGIGTLNTGDLLMLDGSVLMIDLSTPLLSDKLNVTGTVTLSETPGAILALTAVGGFAPQANEIFPLILNDLTDLVTGHFDGLLEGAEVSVNGIPMTITYAADLDGGGVGNDVALTVVPEPTSVAMMLGGLCMLASVRRRRSSRA